MSALAAPRPSEGVHAQVSVAGRVAPGVPAFLVSLVLTLPLSIALARLCASVFEIPFLRHRSSLWGVRPQQARAEGAPG